MIANGPDDWTAVPGEGTNRSPLYLALVEVVRRTIESGSNPEVMARTIVSQLAHAHGLAPSRGEAPASWARAPISLNPTPPTSHEDAQTIRELEDALRTIDAHVRGLKAQDRSDQDSIDAIRLVIVRAFADGTTGGFRDAKLRVEERERLHGPRRAAVSLVERVSDGRILCVWNRRYRGWTLPGGMVEDGETPEAAQRRELLEETGLETVSAQELLVRERVGNSGAPDRAKLVHVFRVTANGQPKPVEGNPVVWLTREEFVEESPFGTFYRTAFEEISSLAGPSPVDAPPEVSRALARLLIRIGSWTSARFDQHIRHELADERADAVLAWLGGHVSSWLAEGEDGKPLYCHFAGAQGAELRWPWLTPAIDRCARHRTHGESTEPCWQCESAAQDRARAALRRGDLVRVEDRKGIYPVTRVLGLADKDLRVMIEPEPGSIVGPCVVVQVVRHEGDRT